MILIKLNWLSLLIYLSFIILKWLFLIIICFVLLADVSLALILIICISCLMFLIIMCLCRIAWIKLIWVKLLYIVTSLKLLAWIELLILNFRKSSVITLSLILNFRLLLWKYLNLFIIILLTVKNRLRLNNYLTLVYFVCFFHFIILFIN
jgi:hypothetical protein